VGKTTLALNIAIGLALRGRSVWMLDAEEPAAASRALDQRRAAGSQPALAASHHPSGGVLRAQVLHHLERFQHIVIDAGGNHATLRTALLLSDTVVVPFQPRAFDMWALPNMVALIDTARSMRDGLEAVAVLNMADTSGADNALAARALDGYASLKYLDTPVGRRKSIPAAASQGMSVLEHQPRDGKANAEMDALLSTLFGVPEKRRALPERSAYSTLFPEQAGAFQPAPSPAAS
jgi:chromosome partitioning protein